MSKKTKDRVTVLEEQIKKLKATIRSKNGTIRQLKSQVKTTKAAWEKSETYLSEVTNGKPLSEVLEAAEKGKPLSKTGKPCPDCGKNGVKKIIFEKFYVASCDCGYRNRINEERKMTKS